MMSEQDFVSSLVRQNARLEVALALTEEQRDAVQAELAQTLELLAQAQAAATEEVAADA